MLLVFEKRKRREDFRRIVLSKRFLCGIIMMNISELFKNGGITMIAENYHTHTYRCHHASGEDREYVEAAIKAGFRVLGFSDHVPYPFDHGYCSSIRMSLGETEGYVQSLLDLRQEYRRDIDIKIGFEAEYFPKHFSKLLTHLSDYPIDYLILGQHFSMDESSGIYFGRATTDPSILTAYVDQVIEGMETGAFTYLAHPDLINFPRVEDDGTTRPNTRYLSEMRRLCEAAKRLSIPLEINQLGYCDRRNYPSDLFFSIAGEIGNDVLIGCDAHHPKQLLDAYSIHGAEQLAKRCGVSLMDHLTLRSPFEAMK